MAYRRAVFAYHGIMVDGGIIKSLAKLAPALLLGWAAVFGAIEAKAETAKPLPLQDCQSLRLALEGNLPFGPGFRRIEVQFPKNNLDVSGHVCRLLTMGTGAHMEGYGIGSFQDMHVKVLGALTAAGLTATPETARFRETSKHGREVFALYKDNAICVTTIVVGIVPGAVPAVNAIKAGKILLNKLKPHQREWWISIDCFTLPPPPQVEAVLEPLEDTDEDALPDENAPSEFALPEDKTGAESGK